MRDVSYRQRGMALPLALVTVLIISTLLSGIMLLSVSHLSLSGTNSDYASALGLAEAGINWELQKIGLDPASADQTAATVLVTEPSGRVDRFVVHVAGGLSGEAWVPPNDLFVTATGTVDGVSRTVRVQASGHGPSGDYALFGINDMKLGGNFTVDGACGSNGTVNGGGGSFLVDGNLWYCGDGASGNVASGDPRVTGDVYDSPVSEYFPTVNDLANQRVKDRWGVTTDQGIDYFATHNDNSTIRDAAGNPVGIKNGTIDWKQKEGIAAAGPTITWDGYNTPVPPALQDKPVVVLLPGDYYFTGLVVGGSDYILIDDAHGAVNIWLGPDGGTGNNPDKLTGNCQFTGDESQVDNFHLYDGSQRPLVMEGTTDFYGNVYAYNGPSATSIIFRGTSNVVGSVIAYSVEQVTGNATVTSPSGGGPGGNGGTGLYYAIAGTWTEVNPL